MNPALLSRVESAARRAVKRLLDARDEEGCWTGELSGSALSTATAVTALAIVDREGRTRGHASRIETGLEWLVARANPDGGWGDTTRSLSNISTTALCWAAFGASGTIGGSFETTVRAAEEWLSERAGSLEPDALSAVIMARYGKDRTFSVPILTMCALAGRLGTGRKAWRNVLPLPFELAACPREWFAALRLPVVSYALPALIAIGQARHVHRPSGNPIVRWIRRLARARTLRVLGEIQPENGGFLEATPLTSFVVMSLAGSGQLQHPVTTKGARFLEASQRGDGCWPIDTNLATWLTTLSVNAITSAAGGGTEGDLDGDWRRQTTWLLRQQYRSVHPYTNAPPGGWAWTDLPGGVPDADDTAGALVALRALRDAGGRGNEWEGDKDLREAVGAGARWLVDLQNRDGGIPTFCRGWGTLPFDRSAPDLTAHSLRAWLAWYGELPESDRLKTGRAIHRALEYLRKSQRADGSWLPLWFGNQHTPDETNPVYGTSRVLRALAEARRQTETMKAVAAGLPREMIDRGTDWLVRAQRPDGGWSGAGEGEGPSSVEETALAVAALAGVLACEAEGSRRNQWREAAVRGTEWLIERVENGGWETPAPIGFYFARLWYFEALYPLIFTVEALGGMRAMLMENAGG